MSLLSLTSVSDDTATPSTIHTIGDLESSTTSLEFSAATTVCNSVSENRKLKTNLNQRLPTELKRRPFQRLPIPELLRTPSKEVAVEAEAEKEDDSVGAKLGFGLSRPHREEEEGTESFPQAPGNSPLSQFQESRVKGEGRRYSFSPSVVPRLRTELRRKQSRSRSVSEACRGKQLYPSPPRNGQVLNPEDLVPTTLVPKKKVLERKPIPASLFIESNTNTQRSSSIPDIFAGFIFDGDSTDTEIQGGNQLGLFSPSKLVPVVNPSRKASSTAADSGIRETSSAQPQTCVCSPKQHQRLRRSTRSISEPYKEATSRRWASLSGQIVRDCSLGEEGNKVILEFGERFLESSDLVELRLHLNHSPRSSHDSSDQEESKRHRTRSGSAPALPASFSEEAERRRYSVGQTPALRRMSRKREGEMRSVYLSRPSPTTSSSTATHLPSQETASPHPTIDGESERIEVLKTPDPPSYHSLEREHLSSSLTLTSTRAFDNMRSAGGGSWDSNLAARARSSSETSMDSLLVLQQRIQQSNHLRQFAPPITDPHLPAAFQRRRTREPSQEDTLPVASSDARRKGARVKLEGTEDGESELVRQYGALRIKKWPLNKEQCELGCLAGEDDLRRGNKEGEMRLRHVFSNPLFPTHSREGVENVGSLRERRAKPPISIAIAPADASSGVRAVVMGPAIPLRKKLSRGQLVSPLTPVHSPPPCPPPTTPLPELPTPTSAPVISSAGGVKRAQLPKRSFIRSGSTPVSPLNATPLRLRHTQHSQTKSQGHNTIPHQISPKSTTIRVQPTTRGEWNPSPASARLLTPPLTGVSLPVLDQQPDTPLSAISENVATPVKPHAAGKFDSLLALLSSNDQGGGDEREKCSPWQVKNFGYPDGSDALVTASSVAPVGIVYGVAL